MFSATSAVFRNRLPTPEWRAKLHDELHARPFPVLPVPCRVSHLAILREADDLHGQREFAHLKNLCAQLDLPEPEAGSSCAILKGHALELRWEKHTEFSTLTLLASGVCEGGFTVTALHEIPEAWLSAMPGEIVVAMHLHIDAMGPAARNLDALHALFDDRRLIGSQLMRGEALVWTAFRLHEDGCSRMQVYVGNLNPCETGRLVQRLLELETYRLMALLSLPLVRDALPSIADIDGAVSAATEHIANLGDDDDEHQVLHHLIELAAKIERIRSQVNYRVSATRAYYALVEQRLRELQEEGIPGLQTLGAFLHRRLAPAVRTCESALERLDNLSTRIDRATDLIRTRVNLDIERQNQHLLATMNRRSGAALRLQQTVEGLSVVAISYYAVDLTQKMLHGLPLPSALRAQILPVSEVGLVPAVIFVVWLVVRSVRRKVVTVRPEPDVPGGLKK